MCCEESVMKKKKSNEVLVACVTGIFGVIVAIITGYASYKSGEAKTEQKINNQINQVVEIDNGDIEKAIEYIINENELLRTELDEKNSEIALLKDQNNKQEKENDDTISEMGDNSVSQITLKDYSKNKQVIYDGSNYKVFPSMDGINANKDFIIAGNEYFDGFILRLDGNVLLNLNGEFSGISLEAGHIDGTNSTEAKVIIEADDEVNTFTINPDKGLQSFPDDGYFNIDNAQIVKISQETHNASAYFGYTNIILYK